MSISMYQNNVARLTRDIAGLEKQSGEETQKIAKLYREISSITNSITKHTSQITARSKLRQINSKQEQIAQSQKRLSDIQNKISTKLSELSRNKQSLERAQEREQKRLDTETKKRRNDELSHVRQVTSELRKQSSNATHRINRFSRGSAINFVPLEVDMLGFVQEHSSTDAANETGNASREAARRRRGGPVPLPEDFKRATVEEWLKVQDHVSQPVFCESKNISPRTLRRWMKELSKG